MTGKSPMLPPAAAKKTARITLRTSRGVKNVIEQAAALKDTACKVTYLTNEGTLA